MKVLIYSHTFAPNVGGVETHAMLLANGLISLSGTEKVDLTVATPTPPGGFDDSALPFHVARRPGFMRIARLILQSDVVNLAGPAFAPLLLCKLLRKPVVVEHHGYQAICPNGLLLHEPDKTACPGHFMRGEYRACLNCNSAVVGRFASLKMLLLTFPRRWLCQFASRNIAMTEHVRRRLGLPRTQVVNLGIPSANIGEAHKEKGPISANDQCTIQFAFVGRFVSEKGLPVLVQAAKILDNDGVNFGLMLIGDGPDRAAIETQVNGFNLKNRIQFTGFLRGKDLDSAMARVSAVVMPSIWEETAGLSAIEHMMRGRPVIVSDIGGLAEVTGDGGLKFSPGDANALAQCMQRLVNDARLLADLGVRAQERARKLFTQARMVEEHRKLFLSLRSKPAA